VTKKGKKILKEKCSGEKIKAGEKRENNQNPSMGNVKGTYSQEGKRTGTI